MLYPLDGEKRTGEIAVGALPIRCFFSSLANAIGIEAKPIGFRQRVIPDLRNAVLT